MIKCEKIKVLNDDATTTVCSYELLHFCLTTLVWCVHYYHGLVSDPVLLCNDSEFNIEVCKYLKSKRFLAQVKYHTPTEFLPSFIPYQPICFALNYLFGIHLANDINQVTLR